MLTRDNVTKNGTRFFFVLYSDIYIKVVNLQTKRETKNEAKRG